MVGFVLRNTLSAHGTVSRGLCRCTPEGFLDQVEEHTRVEPHGAGARSHREGGRVEELSGLAAGRYYTVREGEGISS
jgi:hypothetical protein